MPRYGEALIVYMDRRFLLRRLYVAELDGRAVGVGLFDVDKAELVMRSVRAGQFINDGVLVFGDSARCRVARYEGIGYDTLAVRIEKLNFARVDIPHYVLAARYILVKWHGYDNIIFAAGYLGIHRFDAHVAEHHRERTVDSDGLRRYQVVVGNAHKRHFGLSVEKMRVVGSEIHLYYVALRERIARIYSRYRIIVLALDVEIEYRFVAEVFDNVDSRLDDRFGMSLDKTLLVVHVLGTDAEKHLRAAVAALIEYGHVDYALGAGFGDKHFVCFAYLGIDVAVFFYQFRLEYIHLRRAEEARDKEVRGVVIKRRRRIDLLDDTVLHDDYTRAHRHSLGLVMCNVYKRSCEPMVYLGYLGTHLYAQLCVEVAERLVQKEYLGLADDRTAERDALTLTARKRFGSAAQQRFDTEYLRRFLHFFVYDLSGDVAQSQTERHIIVDGHMRIKRVVLEDHRYIAVLGLDVVNELVVDIQLTRRDILQAGYHAKRGRLTAAGRTDEYDKLLVVYIEVEVADGADSAGIDLVDVS